MDELVLWSYITSLHKNRLFQCFSQVVYVSIKQANKCILIWILWPDCTRASEWLSRLHYSGWTSYIQQNLLWFNQILHAWLLGVPQVQQSSVNVYAPNSRLDSLSSGVVIFKFTVSFLFSKKIFYGQCMASYKELSNFYPQWRCLSV